MLSAYDFVETIDEVIRNVKQFNKDLENGEDISKQLSQFKHWYYIPEIDLFGPSKFIGYKSMKASSYNKRFNKDGRDTEKILKRWFIKLSSETVQKKELTSKLNALINRFDKKMRKNAVIHMLREGWSKHCIATVSIESDEDINYKSRTSLLKSVLREINSRADIVLLPAGFFETRKKATAVFSKVERTVRTSLNKIGLKDTIVCVGVDGRDGKDQVALAINSNGIIAAGRKFYPTQEEINYVDLATNYMSEEDGYSRVFRLGEKTFFLAICYDSFGIKKINTENPGVDAILNLVHGFYPVGQGGSGVGYFARYGFAGASKQWGCPIFGAAVFFNRQVPKRWPTGVFFDESIDDIKVWKYEHNLISQTEVIEVADDNEVARISFYVI